MSGGLCASVSFSECVHVCIYEHVCVHLGVSGCIFVWVSVYLCVSMCACVLWETWGDLRGEAGRGEM